MNREVLAGIAAVGYVAHESNKSTLAEEASLQNDNSERTVTTRSQSKRVTSLKLAQKEHEKLTKDMGVPLELEHSRRSRSSTRRVPIRTLSITRAHGRALSKAENEFKNFDIKLEKIDDEEQKTTEILTIENVASKTTGKEDLDLLPEGEQSNVVHLTNQNVGRHQKVPVASEMLQQISISPLETSDNEIIIPTEVADIALINQEESTSELLQVNLNANEDNVRVVETVSATEKVNNGSPTAINVKTEPGIITDLPPGDAEQLNEVGEMHLIGDVNIEAQDNTNESVRNAENVTSGEFSASKSTIRGSSINQSNNSRTILRSSTRYKANEKSHQNRATRGKTTFTTRRTVFRILSKFDKIPDNHLTSRQRESVKWARAQKCKLSGRFKGNQKYQRMTRKYAERTAPSRTFRFSGSSSRHFERSRKRQQTTKENSSGQPEKRLRLAALSRRQEFSASSSSHLGTVEENSHVDDNRTSEAQGRTDNVIVLVIMDMKNPDGSISSDNWRNLDIALQLVFMDVLEINPGPPPICRDGGWYRGHLKLITCADQRSVDLLSIAILLVGAVWRGAKLQIVLKDDISNRPRCKSLISAATSNPETILQFIKLCNPNLPTSDWLVVGVSEHKNKVVEAVILLNEISLPLLKACDWVINYGFKGITLKVDRLNE